MMRRLLLFTFAIGIGYLVNAPSSWSRTQGIQLQTCVTASGLIFRYGMPIEKPCISTTTSGQSMMITTTLAAKFRKELNEVPFKAGKRLAETEAEFIPVIDALHINPNEPLDPYS
jgi:hypothetical protein